MKRTTLFIALLLFIVATFVGCASWRNKIERDGGLVTTTRSDYIVIVTSGGIVTDIYKLEDKFVQSEAGSDGWNFIDEDGNVRIISGEVTNIRVKDRTNWDKYKECHISLGGTCP